MYKPNKHYGRARVQASRTIHNSSWPFQHPEAAASPSCRSGRLPRPPPLGARYPPRWARCLPTPTNSARAQAGASAARIDSLPWSVRGVVRARARRQPPALCRLPSANKKLDRHAGRFRLIYTAHGEPAVSACFHATRTVGRAAA